MVNLVSDLYYEGDEPNDEGEESEPTGDESPVPSEKDTVVSEFMRDEYIEWPRYDFSASQDRAQLSALQWIRGFSLRKARAIRDENERLVSWCNDQMNQHRLYSRVGSITLKRVVA